MSSSTPFTLNPYAKEWTPSSQLVAYEECSICYDAMIDSVKLACNHSFHSDCIAEWSNVNTVCPLCRSCIVIVTPASTNNTDSRPTERVPRAVNLVDDRERLYIQENSAREMPIVLTPLDAPDKEALAYPFAFIRGDDNDDDDDDRCVLLKEFNPKDFTRGLIDEEPFEIGNFPHNITEYYWIKEGKNDEESWNILSKLALPDGSEAYAFYSASCSYTGFDGYGGMSLVVSKDATKLFYEAIGPALRKTILTEKTAPRATFKLWHNDQELPFNRINRWEVNDIAYAIKGLTAKYLPPEPNTYSRGPPRPRKEYYTINARKGIIIGIDNIFRRRFSNPTKRWTLRMPTTKSILSCKWGKLEVTFG
jgi:hypothetical protein